MMYISLEKYNLEKPKFFPLFSPSKFKSHLLLKLEILTLILIRICYAGRSHSMAGK